MVIIMPTVRPNNAGNPHPIIVIMFFPSLKKECPANATQALPTKRHACPAKELNNAGHSKPLRC